MFNIEELKKASISPKTPKEIKWLIDALTEVCKDKDEVEKILNSTGNPNFKYSIEVSKSINNSSYLKLFSNQGGLITSVQFENLFNVSTDEFNYRLREIEKKYSRIKEEIKPKEVTVNVEIDAEEKEVEKPVKYDKKLLKELLDSGKLYDNLNEEQKLAVYSELKPQCVIAGAGTGKTRILINRFYYLVAEKNINPSRILIITYTKKSAEEIRERIERKISLNPSTLKHICTFHSFFLNILKKDLGIVEEEYKKLEVIEEEAKRNLIRKVYLDLDIAVAGEIEEDVFISINLLLTRYSQENSEKELLDYCEKLNLGRDTLKKIIDNYYENLKNIRSLDFDSFEIKINELFEKSKEIKEKWSKKFDAILIDEFQDTSIKQFEAIKKLTNLNSNIFAVGDPDQSIYGFRNAMPNSFNAFLDHFQIDSPIKLQQNFRSTKNILKISNLLISKNPRDERLKNELWSDNCEGEKVIYEWSRGNKEMEIDMVVNKVSKLISEQKINQNDIAILYRNTPYWELYKKMVDKLTHRGFNYKTRNTKQPFLNSREIRFIIALLNVTVLDDPSNCYLNDIFTNMKNFTPLINPMIYREIWKFSNWAVENKYKFSEAIVKMTPLGIYHKASKLLKNLKVQVDKWRSDINDYPLDLWIELFLQNNEENLLFFEIKSWRVDKNIKRMMKMLKKRSQKMEKDEMVRKLLFIDFFEFEREEEDGIFYDTIHQSKGLEWKYVFLMGLDRTFPSDWGKKEVDMEEERRIAYVAFTRPKEMLFLTGAIKQEREESVFMDETLKKSPALKIIK